MDAAKTKQYVRFMAKNLMAEKQRGAFLDTDVLERDPRAQPMRTLSCKFVGRQKRPQVAFRFRQIDDEPKRRGL
jgi:hypothetical protein